MPLLAIRIVEPEHDLTTCRCDRCIAIHQIYFQFKKFGPHNLRGCNCVECEILRDNLYTPTVDRTLPDAIPYDDYKGAMRYAFARGGAK